MRRLHSNRPGELHFEPSKRALCCRNPGSDGGIDGSELSRRRRIDLADGGVYAAAQLLLRSGVRRLDRRHDVLGFGRRQLRDREDGRGLCRRRRGSRCL